MASAIYQSVLQQCFSKDDLETPQVNPCCTWGGHAGAAAEQYSKLGSVR